VSEVVKAEVVDEAHGHSTHHEPSVVPDPNWGWVGESPKLFRIAGFVVAVFLLLMIHGNQKGHVEDVFLVGFAAFILLIIFKDWALNKMSLRK